MDEYSQPSRKAMHDASGKAGIILSLLRILARFLLARFQAW